MKLLKFLLFLAFFTVLDIAPIQASNMDSTTIYGSAPSYAGQRLTIYFQSNIVSKERKALTSFNVNSDGKFKASLLLPGTTKVFFALGKIQGYAVLQPKGICEIAFPPFNALEGSDSMNPFFASEIVPLAVIKGDLNNLNKNIGDFDDSFNSLYAKNVYLLFKKENEKPILKLISRLDSLFPSKDVWFQQYKKFSYHKLYDLSFERRKEYVIDKFFKGAPFMPYNNAYADAFRASFYRYFAFKFSSTSNEQLKKAWSSHSIPSISLALKQSSVLTDDDLREAVILKNLYDAYYSDIYDKDEVLDLIAQARTSFSTVYNKSIALAIYNDLIKLRVGFQAPKFELKNFVGKSKALTNFRGKFVYLNFMQTQNFACKKDMLGLAQLRMLTKKDLEIVTVITDKDVPKSIDFVKANKFDWSFLSIGNSESVLDDYKIRVLPTYFLIDPEGNLMLSPAPSPEENFYEVFAAQAKAYRNKELRKNPPKQKSIFDM